MFVADFAAAHGCFILITKKAEDKTISKKTYNQLKLPRNKRYFPATDKIY